MNTYLVVGAGPIGSAVARQLAERNDGADHVIVATRSGSGPVGANIERIHLDATDEAAVKQAAAGTAAIFNCVNPPYTRWSQDWPPIAHSLLAAAIASGAVLATCSNLYAYGPSAQPVTTDLPLAALGTKGQVRARMWSDALAAHESGDARVVEVRGSDYLGPDVESHMGERVVPRVLAGKKVSVVGSPDQPHSWTYSEDMAATLIAAADSPSAWGRAWHSPVNQPRTQAEVVSDMATALGTSNVAVKGLPKPMLSAAGVFVPMIRELKETLYQFEAPFVIDDRETREILGLEPTPWGEIIDAHVRNYRDPGETDAADALLRGAAR
ncbi:MAG: NAD-dependent epimerase/dehydratase family protein [Actinobacteria bacterium]|nr:NAD-dependent epimerase/dehydratase family protein [Actinomycetota bacterium]